MPEAPTATIDALPPTLNDAAPVAADLRDSAMLLIALTAGLSDGVCTVTDVVEAVEPLASAAAGLMLVDAVATPLVDAEAADAGGASWSRALTPAFAEPLPETELPSTWPLASAAD
ncbi:MAG: hypothetical protein EPO22_01650 [Dehalococcoidia bacterium]|nr:MAG: hypothetical protein EPO22_01650 [Dehalococcoidia bacterium]